MDPQPAADGPAGAVASGPRALLRGPSSPARPDASGEERSHRVFVLGCVALVFATVFVVPVAFLRGGPATAGVRGAGAGEDRTPAGGSGPSEASVSAAGAGSVREADLNALHDEDDMLATADPPPPQTIADACRRLPGYGSVFQEPQENESGIRVLEGTFGRRSFYVLAKELTRDAESVDGVQEAVRREGLFDFRRIRPDDRYRLFLDESGRIRMFEYARSDTEVYHVVRTGDVSFLAHAVDVPVEVRVGRFSGTVQGSLGRSLVAEGLHLSIVPLLTDIFSYSVDFSTQARDGDRFRLAVEERWIGGKFNRYVKLLGFEYVGARTGNVQAYAFDVGGRTRYFAPDGSSVQRVFLNAPCRYEAISSRFDPRRMHPVLNRRMPHEGVDLVAPTGTPVYSIADGTLAFHGDRGPNGLLVVVQHSRDTISYYAHLSGFARGLRDGMAIRKGQLVGYVGSTGRSTGPHLHFAIKFKGEFVDPEAYLKSRQGQPVPPELIAEFRRTVTSLAAQLAQVPLADGPAPSTPPPEPEVGLMPAPESAL